MNLDYNFINNYEFGGTLLKRSHPKIKRPFLKGKPIHIIMSSKKSLFLKDKNTRLIQKIVKNKYKGIQVKELIIKSNHIHIVLKAKNRKFFTSFLKCIPGLIIRKLLRTEKGSPLKSQDSNWSYRPYSRIIQERTINLTQDPLLGLHLYLLNLIPNFDYFNST